MSDKDKKNEVEIKPKRKSNGRNSPVIGDNGVSLKKGDATRYANIMLDMMALPAVDRSNVQELENRFLEYIQYCADRDIKLGNQMAYLALGISKDDAYNWENGRTLTPEHSDFIKKVRQICAGNREILMQDGKVNPVTGIFWQKNYDGLKDVQEVDIRPVQPLGDQLSPEDIAKRIPKNLPVDAEFEEK